MGGSVVRVGREGMGEGEGESSSSRRRARKDGKAGHYLPDLAHTWEGGKWAAQQGKASRSAGCDWLAARWSMVSIVSYRSRTVICLFPGNARWPRSGRLCRAGSLNGLQGCRAFP